MDDGSIVRDAARLGDYETLRVVTSIDPQGYRVVVSA